ncbi:MAG: type II CRISPR RNA-guided endonuclease Cas9 [Spirochaetaceae bacterium]|jgi:CRISPR-associated endonuclease Csn1|nr:type II CRISPR RNA-guided endonuclease Cas9 [Spirochaetaceae bacterium]
MKYRLGLDLGTNSIGWAVLPLDSQGEPSGVAAFSSRIFSDGREPKSGAPLALQRRIARGVRRTVQRRRQRRRNLFHLLQEEGLYPKSEEAAALKKLDPHLLRVKALDEKLAPEELGRALFHLGVRRGFKSNRKNAGEERVPDDEALAKIERAGNNTTQGEKCLLLKEDLRKSGLRSIGEFLLRHNTGAKANKQGGLRFTPGRFPWYPLRELYEQEFDAIENKQNPYYPDIAWEKIRSAIFYQRPLKKQERGRCAVMPEYIKTFKVMPSSIRFRILKEAYNLKFYNERMEPIELSAEQRTTLITMLDKSKKDVPFDLVRKKLNVKCRFNLESEIRTAVNGNITGGVLREEKLFGPLWDTFALREQDDIVEMLIEEEDEQKIIAALSKYQLSDEQKKRIARYIPTGGTTNFSKEFTQRLVAVMEKESCGEMAAFEKLGIKHSKEHVQKYETLPYYGKILRGSALGGNEAAFGEEQPEKKYGKISNPTVHVALNQTKIVVNALIKKYGKPAEVVIELSRELKASREGKEWMQTKQAKNVKQNALYNKIIKKTAKIAFPNRTDRLKWRLWEELSAKESERCCLYCGIRILKKQLFSNDIQIDHILPFSKTLLDAESNLTVAHSDCNMAKGNASPYDAFSSNPKKYNKKYNWDKICARVNNLQPRARAKIKRFAPDAMKSFEEQDAFIARQLTDTAYLAKMARKYLCAVCDNVWSASSRITKLLRDEWDIDSLLKRKIDNEQIKLFNLKESEIGMYKKNRYDHRHHALDAIVIGLIDRATVKNISTLSGKKLEHRIVAPKFPFNRKDIAEKLRNTVVSHKPDHGVEGKLSLETALAKINIDGEEIFANRIPLTSLKEAAIERIIDPVIRQKLQAFLEKHKTKKFEACLAAFGEKENIKRVRCKTFVQKPICIPPRKNNPLSVTRYYNPGDYFCAIIWELPSKKERKTRKYEAQYIRRTEVKKIEPKRDNKTGDTEKRSVSLNKNAAALVKLPHPAAKKICVLFKGDCIELNENGNIKKARVAGYSATQNKLDIRPINASDDVRSWLVATAEQAREKGWKKQKGQYFVSVNVLFDEQAAAKITVSPLGEILRKKS